MLSVFHCYLKKPDENNINNKHTSSNDIKTVQTRENFQLGNFD